VQVGINRLTYPYQAKNPDDATLRDRMRGLAKRRQWFGYRRLGVMLERKNHVANHKKLYRIYTEEGLKIRRMRVLEKLAITHGLPETIVVDNGPEFIGKNLDAWANKRV
jgi:hypothetical protein